MSEETPEQKVARLQKSESWLREQQAMYIQMLDAMEDMILVKDRQSRITYANKAFRDFYGMTLAELQGIIDAPFNQPEYTEQYLVDDAYVINTGNVLNIPEEPVTRHDGKVSFFNTIKSPIFSSAGAAEHMVAVCRDITQQKIAEEERIRTQKALDEAVKRVSEFNSMVSHELRTPLTSIRAALGLIEGGQTEPIGDNTMELISIARGECDRLVRLINDLLDIKKMEADKIDLKFERLSPQEIVNDVLNTLRGVAQEASIRLVSQSVGKITFEGDRDRIIQVLTNLVSNAVKFSPAGSEVVIAAEGVNADFIKFSVSDKGPGIPDGAREKLFTAFHQVDSSDSRAKGGTGLGLAISKGIVERHGGTIGVISPAEGGSIFWFALPVTKSEIIA